MQPAYLRGVRSASSRADKITGVGIAIAMHAVVIFILLQYAPARTALIHAVPLMVSLIAPPAPKPEVLPKPLPVKHLPQQPRVAPPQPVLAAAAEAPSTVSVPLAPPVPHAPIDSAPAPVAAPSPPAPPPVAEKPAPVVPPNFNANYLSNPAPNYPPDFTPPGAAGQGGYAGVCQRGRQRQSSANPQ